MTFDTPKWLKWDDETIKNSNNIQEKYKYVYGLKDVKINYKEFEQNSVYVSKPFEINGNVIEVSLESEEHNPLLNTSSKSINPYDTSVEYYITFDETPTYKDWVPILPKDQFFIKNEVLLLKDSSYCKLRFPCDTSKEIKVFKNGTKLNKHYWSHSNNVINIDKRFDKYATYTVQYYPDINKTSPWDVELLEKNRNIVPFIGPDGSEGELFKNGTNRNGKIILSKYPYVDRSNLEKYPVSVSLEEANIAIPARKTMSYIDESTEPVKTQNITNYLNLQQEWLTPYNPDLQDNGKMTHPIIEYRHEGRSLDFTETFNHSRIFTNMETNHGDAWIRVKYNYLKAKVRLKIILRNTSNKSNAITPSVKNYKLIFKIMR